MNIQQKIHTHLTQLIRSVQEQNAQQVAQLSNIDQSTLVFLENRHANVPFSNMLKAFHKNEFQKAHNHAQKLQRMIRLNPNYFPFEIGEEVYLIRDRHGWYKGHLKVTITSRVQNKKGVWSYTSKQIGTDFEFDIRHTRDARRLT